MSRFRTEQEEFRSVVREFLQSKSGSADVRRLMETDEGLDRAVWGQMAGQLELQGLLVPEQYGGSGLTIAELAMVAEEMGRVLFCGPYLSQTLAIEALLGSGDESARAEWLPRLAAGTTIGTLAVAEDETGWSTEQLRTRSDGASTPTLRGRKTFVTDGAVADLLVVAADSDAGPSLFLVDGFASGVSPRLLTTVDPTRKLAVIDFLDAPARLLGRPGEAGPVLARVLQIGAVVLAAEQVGAAQRCLEVSVEHAKNRVQYGRPIGSFQAVKHKCAEMLLAVESARSAAGHAVLVALGERQDPLGPAASIAKALCSDALTSVTADTIQVLGGIGFTWEHDAHLYYRRAKSSAHLFGDPHEHRDQVAQHLFDTCERAK
ncbi:acyl-CoA dehydrogenase family protein [Cryptosporangium sp. NPDC051539]|uniref:acyl-CoA dehydrogenase family protein n=1 Tax=Cryptosporangium sp. NPDC051539 TaxID=3363962 RepID=UPI00379B7DB5